MNAGAPRDAVRVTATGPADVYGLEDYDTVVGRLEPGGAYLALAIYDEWVHVSHPSTGLEGWAPAHTVRQIE